MAHVPCAFTMSMSTREGESRASCLKARGRVMIGCRNCVPGSIVWRCNVCFHKLRLAIGKRLPSVETSLFKAMVTPELDALLHTDWKSILSHSSEMDSSLLSPLVFCEHEQQMMWRDRCPCCFDFVVEKPLPAMSSSFPELQPNVVEDIVMDVEAERLQLPSGIPQASLCRVRIVTIRAIISHSESMSALFRVADDEHMNYKLLWEPPPEAADHRPRWLLVRGVAEGEEPKLLSLIAFDALSNPIKRVPENEIAAALLDATRHAAIFHGHGTSRDNLMAANTVESCIRVNRVSGPFGHLEVGQHFSAYRAKVLDAI